MANRVYSRIVKGREDRFWSYADFHDLDVLAVAATLSRLVRKRVLHRARKGLYYRPKKTAFGESRPTPDAIANAVLKTRPTPRPLHLRRGIRLEERTALKALRDVNHVPDAMPGEIIARFKSLFRANELDFGRLARFAAAEPPRVRALLGAMGEDLKSEGVPLHHEELERLKSSLNFLSVFRIPGIEKAVHHAAHWNIQRKHASAIRPSTVTDQLETCHL